LNPTDLELYDDLSDSYHALSIGGGYNTSSDYPGSQSVLVRQYLNGFTRNSANGSLYSRFQESYVATYIPVGARTDYAGTIYTVENNSSGNGDPNLGGNPGRRISFTVSPDIWAGDYLTLTWQGATQYDISNNGGGELGSPIVTRFEATLPDGAVFYWRIEDGYDVPTGFDGDLSGSFTLSANSYTLYVTPTNTGMPVGGPTWTFNIGFYSDPGYTNQVGTLGATGNNQNYGP
jgi:hypothetical protein